MKNLFFVLIFFSASSFAASENILELSLTLNEKGDSQVVDGAKVVSYFKKNGIIDQKPDSYDYEDYYVLKKNIEFLGSKLIVFVYEHMDSYLGCCVNPGNAVILLPNVDSSQIELFAKKNKCSISRGQNIFHVPKKALRVNKLDSSESLIELSCKSNDINRANDDN